MRSLSPGSCPVASLTPFGNTDLALSYLIFQLKNRDIFISPVREFCDDILPRKSRWVNGRGMGYMDGQIVNCKMDREVDSRVSG